MTWLFLYKSILVLCFFSVLKGIYFCLRRFHWVQLCSPGTFSLADFLNFLFSLPCPVSFSSGPCPPVYLRFDCFCYYKRQQEEDFWQCPVGDGRGLGQPKGLMGHCWQVVAGDGHAIWSQSGKVTPVVGACVCVHVCVCGRQQQRVTKGNRRETFG